MKLPRKAPTLLELQDPRYAKRTWGNQRRQLLNEVVYGKRHPKFRDRVKTWWQLTVVASFK
ncbi:hypothetical protein LZ3411_2079 [Levilactobacillus zymae]|uniref:Uncharacterized protein n=1 Tax=Levilactobacillus zymae TaxID=267363 RepID=A0A1Y6JYW7_9LACO|nr:hypothetical protein LZ3411_2079 [Levilactobacillus zymae]